MAISPYVIKSETAPDDVKAFLDDPKPLQPEPRAAAGQAEAFLELSLRARGAERRVRQHFLSFYCEREFATGLTIPLERPFSE